MDEQSIIQKLAAEIMSDEKLSSMLFDTGFLEERFAEIQETFNIDHGFESNFDPKTAMAEGVFSNEQYNIYVSDFRGECYEALREYTPDHIAAEGLANNLNDYIIRLNADNEQLGAKITSLREEVATIDKGLAAFEKLPNPEEWADKIAAEKSEKTEKEAEIQTLLDQVSHNDSSVQAAMNLLGEREALTDAEFVVKVESFYEAEDIDISQDPNDTATDSDSTDYTGGANGQNAEDQADSGTDKQSSQSDTDGKNTDSTSGEEKTTAKEANPAADEAIRESLDKVFSSPEERDKAFDKLESEFGGDRAKMAEAAKFAEMWEDVRGGKHEVTKAEALDNYIEYDHAKDGYEANRGLQFNNFFAVSSKLEFDIAAYKTGLPGSSGHAVSGGDIAMGIYRLLNTSIIDSLIELALREIFDDLFPSVEHIKDSVDTPEYGPQVTVDGHVSPGAQRGEGSPVDNAKESGEFGKEFGKVCGVDITGKERVVSGTIHVWRVDNSVSKETIAVDGKPTNIYIDRAMRVVEFSGARYLVDPLGKGTLLDGTSKIAVGEDGKYYFKDLDCFKDDPKVAAAYADAKGTSVEVAKAEIRTTATERTLDVTARSIESRLNDLRVTSAVKAKCEQDYTEKRAELDSYKEKLVADKDKPGADIAGIEKKIASVDRAIDTLDDMIGKTRADIISIGKEIDKCNITLDKIRSSDPIDVKLDAAVKQQVDAKFDVSRASVSADDEKKIADMITEAKYDKIEAGLKDQLAAKEEYAQEKDSLEKYRDKLDEKIERCTSDTERKELEAEKAKVDSAIGKLEPFCKQEDIDKLKSNIETMESRKEEDDPDKRKELDDKIAQFDTEQYGPGADLSADDRAEINSVLDDAEHSEKIDEIKDAIEHAVEQGPEGSFDIVKDFLDAKEEEDDPIGADDFAEALREYLGEGGKEEIKEDIDTDLSDDDYDKICDIICDCMDAFASAFEDPIEAANFATDFLESVFSGDGADMDLIDRIIEQRESDSDFDSEGFRGSIEAVVNDAADILNNNDTTADSDLIDRGDSINDVIEAMADRLGFRDSVDQDLPHEMDNSPIDSPSNDPSDNLPDSSKDLSQNTDTVGGNQGIDFTAEPVAADGVDPEADQSNQYADLMENMQGNDFGDDFESVASDNTDIAEDVVEIIAGG